MKNTFTCDCGNTCSADKPQTDAHGEGGFSEEYYVKCGCCGRTLN